MGRGGGGNRKGEGEVEKSWQGPGVGRLGGGWEGGQEGGDRRGAMRRRLEGGSGEGEMERGQLEGGDGEGAMGRGRREGGKGEGEKNGEEEGAFYRWI